MLTLRTLEDKLVVLQKLVTKKEKADIFKYKHTMSLIKN